MGKGLGSFTVKSSKQVSIDISLDIRNGEERAREWVVAEWPWASRRVSYGLCLEYWE